MKFSPIILALVLIGCAVSWAHLCARIYKRGSNTESWNLTLEGTTSANIILPLNQVGLLAPEYQCRLDLGLKINGSWQVGSSQFKLRRDQQMNIRYDATKGGFEPRYFCCSCHPVSCQLVKLGNACARLFSQTNCHTCFDKGLTVYPGDSDANMTYGTQRGSHLYGHTSGILSTVVNWGCKLTLFQKPNFEGNWRFYYNGVDESYGNYAGGVWRNEVGSYKCECENPNTAAARKNQNVGEWITLVTSGNETVNSSEEDLNSVEKEFQDLISL